MLAASVAVPGFEQNTNAAQRFAFTNLKSKASSFLESPSKEEGMSDVTQILREIRDGKRQSAEQLLSLVYTELKRIAAQKMAGEAPGNTLQPTALVHEAWIKLVGDGDAQFENRAHFFSAAAEAMRRILVDSARRKGAAKRGSGAAREELKEEHWVEVGPSDELLAVDEALNILAKEDPSAANLVKLRYFVGMSMNEAATTMGMSLRSTEALWTFARAWLRRHIGRQHSIPEKM
jgi:RNA polymerase sigma factor (TIGR02999 family)